MTSRTEARPQERVGAAAPAEPRRLRDFSARELGSIFLRAGKEALDDRVTDVAAALAFYSFLAIPAVFLVVLGAFGLVADPAAIQRLMDRLSGVAPPEALTLLEDSLQRVSENRGGGIALLAVGLGIALWTSTGAMTALIRGLNVAYDQEESRGFVRQRLVALAMLASLVLAALLVFGLLVLGPIISRELGEALGLETAVRWLWWTAQWPILFGALLLAFLIVLRLGPNLQERRWPALAVGAIFAVVVWLVASGVFAFYVSNFGSYNKAWGSLAAVIIMLTWLWLSALALLLGAEVNAETRRAESSSRARSAGEAPG